MTDKNIESILNEQRLFTPPESFAANARIKADDLQQLYADAEADYEGFWAERARRAIQWDKEFTTVLDDSNAPNYAWFTDGELNVSKNCLDVHLESRGDKPAIIFEGEDCE